MIDLYLLPAAECEAQSLLPETDIELAEFLAIAAHNKVGANLYLQLSRFSKRPDAALMSALEQTYNGTLARNQRRLVVGLPILREIRSRGVEVIILKGNSIAEELFLDIGYKPMNDIDILVKQTDLDVIHEIFMKNNLLSAAPLEGDIRKQEKYSHHWPPFFDKKLELFLGTHWNIAAPTRGLKIPIDDFWNEKVEFKLMGETFHRLSPKHNLFHLCVHLNSAKTGLREIGDISKLIDGHGSLINVSEFIEMTILAGANSEVFEAISLANELLPHPLCGEILSRLNLLVDESLKRSVFKRMTPRHKLLHIRTNYISKIEKTFALFMLTESPVEKTLLLAKMWKLYLLVPGPEAQRLDYQFPETTLIDQLKASFFAPVKISQVFIKDMGPLIFVIVTLRHQWVLLKSYGTYIRKKIRGEPVHTLESYAAGLGLSFSEIKEISALD